MLVEDPDFDGDTCRSEAEIPSSAEMLDTGYWVLNAGCWNAGVIGMNRMNG